MMTGPTFTKRSMPTFSANTAENLRSFRLLRRSDGQTWTEVLGPLISDCADVEQPTLPTIDELTRLIDILLDEIENHPLPAFVMYASPTDTLKVTPLSFSSALVSHRAERLIQAVELLAGALSALENGSLQVSAVAARSLFELAVVCRDIHQPILTPWRLVHGNIGLIRAAAKSEKCETFSIVWQTRTATRFYEEEHGWPQAKSVLTRIDRLGKRLSSARQIYDMLCDATHPNIESHATLWRTEYLNFGDLHAIRLEPEHSNSTIKQYIIDAVRLAILMIIPFARDLWWVAADITNTCNITPNDRTILLGLPARNGRNEQCSCGSGEVTRLCTHPEPTGLSDEELGRR